jgi:KAP family P-loop domain
MRQQISTTGALRAIRFRRLRKAGASAAAFGGEKGEQEPGAPPDRMQPAAQAVFRNFDPHDFCETPVWDRLKEILTNNGGCYAIYGPRGSGKSWLMLKAIDEANRADGLGLWFPCPSRYKSSDFLSTLSDNLAHAVERRFARGRSMAIALARSRNVLAVVSAALVLLALILYGIRGLNPPTRFSSSATTRFLEVFPMWVWILIATGAFLVVVATIVITLYYNIGKGSLIREATSLRERIRFTQSLKLGSNVGVSGGNWLTGSLQRSRERTMNERPTSIASLVFDFRNLAEHIARMVDKPFVICIDELDKIKKPAAVRSLLRDIKGIFEVRGGYFLVSISEEAAASLQSANLRSGGRDELNSSFYSVIGLPPLEPAEAVELLTMRGLGDVGLLPAALCLLAGGNRRELIRMADGCTEYARRHRLRLNESTIIGLLEEESSALLRQIIRELSGDNSAIRDDNVKYRAWRSLPRDSFNSVDNFVRLGNSAIQNHWRPPWDADEQWDRFGEPWRRLLLRMFVSARILTKPRNTGEGVLLEDESVVVVLRDILLMATRDSAVARLMLSVRFGNGLSEPYQHVTARVSR